MFVHNLTLISNSSPFLSLCLLNHHTELIIKITGKSSPMMETFSAFSMVAVYETRKGLKFVHVSSEKFAGKFTVLIFMDNRLGQTMSSEL